MTNFEQKDRLRFLDLEPWGSLPAGDGEVVLYPIDYVCRIFDRRGIPYMKEVATQSGKTHGLIRIHTDAAGKSVLSQIQPPMDILYQAVINPTWNYETFETRLSGLDKRLWKPGQRKNVQRTYYDNRAFLLQAVVDLAPEYLNGNFESYKSELETADALAHDLRIQGGILVTHDRMGRLIEEAVEFVAPSPRR